MFPICKDTKKSLIGNIEAQNYSKLIAFSRNKSAIFMKKHFKLFFFKKNAYLCGLFIN